MALSREDFVEVLKDSYSAYYTIHEDAAAPEGLPLAFRADYSSRDERYWLTKSVVTWANEKYEYCYVFMAESFSPELALRCMDWAWEDALPRVRPHGEHQCTNAKVVFIADSVSPETAKAVKKKSATRSYRQGIKPQGYSNLLAGITDLGTRKTVTNGAGHELVPYFKKLFAARA